MEREELIKKLRDNQYICWILWEANNLEDTFNIDGDDGPKVKTNVNVPQGGHSVVDVVENLRGSCMHLLGIDVEDNATWDMIEGINIILRPLAQREENDNFDLG